MSEEEEEDKTEVQYDKLFEIAEQQGTQHILRERFRAFIELYLEHTPLEELKEILENKQIKLTLGDVDCDLYHPSVDAEIVRRWEAFLEYSREQKGET